MQIITTTDYPTHCAAQDNPGYLAQQLNPKQQDGYELAAYSSDDVIANITVRGDDFLVQVEGVTLERFYIDGMFPSYDTAEAFLVEMVEERR